MAPFTAHGVGLLAAGTFQSLRVKIIASTWHLFIESFTHVSLSTFLLTQLLNHHPPGPPSSITAVSCSLSTVWVLLNGVRYNASGPQVLRKG